MLFKVWDLRFYCNQEFWLPDAEILNLKEFKESKLIEILENFRVHYNKRDTISDLLEFRIETLYFDVEKGKLDFS